MAYYLRVLGIRDPDIHLDELRAALQKAGLTASFGLHKGCEPHKWTTMEVDDADSGHHLAQIERNVVKTGSLAQSELDEFREIIRVHQPMSAVQWLEDYFNRVRVVYAIRVMEAALIDDNFEIVNVVRNTIWEHTGGLLQNDLEGFSNDEGYHILWQFSDDATGDKYCAVLDGGCWVKFRMDLGDHFQRMAFWAGEVPQMAVRL